MDKNPTLWGVIAALVGTGIQGFGASGPVVGAVLLAIAGAFLVYAVREPVLEFVSRTMPLRTAASAFYEEARKNKSFWSIAADRMAVENTPAARLNYCAHALKTGDIQWYGVHAPSTVIEELDMRLVNNCSFLNESLDILGTDGQVYTSVRVNKKGLTALLKKVRSGGF